MRTISDGRIIIDTEINNSGIEKGVNSLGNVASKGLKLFSTVIIGAGVALGGLGIASLKLASDLGEVENVTNTVFGDGVKKINEFADSASEGFGLAETNAKQFMGTMGGMLKTAGLNNSEFTDMSINLTKMSGDMSSFYNKSGEVIQQDLQSYFAGSSETMLKYGLNANIANLETYALSKGINKSWQEMSQAEQQTLRYNYMMEKLNYVSGDFAKTSDSLANQMRVASLNVQSLGADIGNLLLPMAQAAMKAFNGVADQLREAFKSEELKASIVTIAEGIGSLITNLATLIAEWLPKIIEGFAWIMNNSNTIAAGIIGIGTAMAVMNVANMIMGVVAAFKLAQEATVGLTAAQWLLDVAMAAVGGPIVLVVALIVGLVAAFVYLWNTSEGFRAFWIGLWETISTFFVGVWNGIIAFFTTTIPLLITNIIMWFTGIGVWFGQLWIGIQQVFINGWNAIANFFVVTIPMWISSIIAWFGELPTNIGYILGFLLATFVNGLVAIWNFITVTIPAIIADIVTWFSELPGKIWTWLVKIVSDIGTWGSQMYQSATSSISNMINGVINWFSQLPGRIGNWLSQTISNIISWGSNMVSSGVSAASDLVSGIVDTISNLPGQMLDIGVNIVKGIWDGISGGAGWLLDKVSGFVGGIVDGFKDGLDINSPSRVMRDLVGVNIVKGIGVGIKLEDSNLQKDIKSSLNKTINGIDGNGLSAKMRSVVDYETARTTASVVAQNNFSIAKENPTIDTTTTANPPITVIAKWIVDGKEFTQTVVAPNQGVLEAWGDGR